MCHTYILYLSRWFAEVRPPRVQNPSLSWEWHTLVLPPACASNEITCRSKQISCHCLRKEVSVIYPWRGVVWRSFWSQKSPGDNIKGAYLKGSDHFAQTKKNLNLLSVKEQPGDTLSQRWSWKQKQNSDPYPKRSGNVPLVPGLDLFSILKLGPTQQDVVSYLM